MLFWLQLMPQGFYLIITHNVGLNDLSEVLDEREQTKIPTQELVQMAEFVLKNNFFKFSDKVHQQISGTAIGNKFAPPYECILMDLVENKFLHIHECPKS